MNTLTLSKSDIFRAFTLAALFGLLAFLAISITRGEDRIAAIWLPNAVLVAVILRGERNDLLIICAAFIANIGANFSAGDDLLRATGLAFVNGIEIGIICLGMRRFGFARPDMMRFNHLIAFVIIGGVVAPLISGGLAAGMLDTADSAMFDLWLAWFLTDSLGMLIVAPAIWIANDAWKNRADISRRGTWEWLAILGGGSLILIVIFSQSRFPLLFVATPVVFLAAFRLGGLGATVATMLVAVVASVATSLGSGPITLIESGMTDRLHVLQCFLAVNFALSLPVAAVLDSRTQITRALGDSEALNRSILDNMREVVFKTDADGRWIFLNPAWQDFAGFGVRESLGWRTTRLLHPDDRETAHRVYADIISGEIAECTLRQRFVRRTGETCHIDVSIKRLDDGDGNFIGTTGSIRDVSELAHQQQMLTERNALLSLLADNVTDAVLRLSLTGECLYASPSARGLFELAPEHMVGINLITGFHPDDDGPVRSTFADLASGKLERTLIAFRSASPLDPARFRWMEANCAVVRDPETRAPMEIIASIRDVSATKRLEQELRDAHAAAELAVVAKSAFLANMSHEIRTPMNGVLGFTDLLRESDLDADQREHVDMIAESGHSMMQLLNDILDTSKIEAGQMQIAEEPVELRHKVRGVIKLMEPGARVKAITLRTDIGESVPETIVGDALRLRQILINLIGNAIKFTQQGHVELTISTSQGSDGPMLRFEVTDTGIGIAPDRVETIFETFTQADTSIARRFGGTGLGLSITRQLVELMSGNISVRSREGEGSTFTVILPLRESKKEKPDKVDAGAFPVLAEKRCSRRVLIAEDNKINQALMRSIMQKIGVSVIFASDGAEAVAVVTAEAEAGQPFDLILMDMQMPIMDGLEATRRLREAGFDCDRLPIVALTANAYAEDIAACREAGMQYHLSKPVTLATIEEILERFAPMALSGPAIDGSSTSPPCIEELPSSLVSQYQDRKAKTLAEAERLAGMSSICDLDSKQLIDLLHQLAGTAGFFGDDMLGSAASQFENELEAASSEMRPDIALAGLAGLSKAKLLSPPT